MKRGSDYAKRIKRLYHDLVKKYGKPAPIESAEPIEQMIIGILAMDTSISKAQAVYKKLRQQTVDLNDLRVTPAIELAQLIGDGVPLAGRKAQRIVNALNAVRRRQDTLDLGFLRQRGRREAREYLESLDGVGPTVAAHVTLLSLGGHAIPVDNLELYVLRKEGMVDGDADIATVQAFLERWIGASEAADFAHLMNRHASVYASRVVLEKLPELLYPVPPPKPQPPPPPVEVKGKPDKEKEKDKGKGKSKGKPEAKVKTEAKVKPAPGPKERPQAPRPAAAKAARPAAPVQKKK